MTYLYPPRGYVALLTALLLASALAVLVFFTGSLGIHARTALLDSASHTEARLLAQSCAAVALRDYAQDPVSVYLGPNQIERVDATHICSILSVATSSTEIILRTVAQVLAVAVTLETHANGNGSAPYSITSDQEIVNRAGAQ